MLSYDLKLGKCCYDSNDFHLLKCESNTMNLYYVQESHGSYRTKLIEWDLSEEDEMDLVDLFLVGQVNIFNGKWETYEDFQSKIKRFEITVPVLIA